MIPINKIIKANAQWEDAIAAEYEIEATTEALTAPAVEGGTVEYDPATGQFTETAPGQEVR